MSDITEEDVMKYCQSRNLMLVTKESLEYMHRPIVIENAPTVEAIPIEFIKRLIEKFDCERGNAIKDTFAHILTGLLEFWEFEQEKENERP